MSHMCPTVCVSARWSSLLCYFTVRMGCVGGLDCVSCVSDGLCVCSLVTLVVLCVCVPPSNKICEQAYPFPPQAGGCHPGCGGAELGSKKLRLNCGVTPCLGLVRVRQWRCERCCGRACCRTCESPAVHHRCSQRAAAAGCCQIAVEAAAATGGDRKRSKGRPCRATLAWSACRNCVPPSDSHRSLACRLAS